MAFGSWNILGCPGIILSGFPTFGCPWLVGVKMPKGMEISTKFCLCEDVDSHRKKNQESTFPWLGNVAALVE